MSTIRGILTALPKAKDSSTFLKTEIIPISSGLRHLKVDSTSLIKVESRLLTINTPLTASAVLEAPRQTSSEINSSGHHILYIDDEEPLVSGYLKEDEVKAARDLGIRKVVRKPDTVDQLGAIIHELLNREQ